MKISKNRLKEIIKEEMEMISMDEQPHVHDENCGHDYEDPEYDQEGYMTKSQLYKIGDLAMQLHDMIDDNDNLPEWMQSKVAQMSQMISDVKYALEYDQEEGNYDDYQGAEEEGEPTYDSYQEEEMEQEW